MQKKKRVKSFIMLSNSSVITVLYKGLYVLIEVDIRKGFDIVNWDFILLELRIMGILDKMV